MTDHKVYPALARQEAIPYDAHNHPEEARFDKPFLLNVPQGKFKLDPVKFRMWLDYQMCDLEALVMKVYESKHEA